MNEWSIMVIRLLAIQTRLDEAYDHAALIQNIGSETDERIGRDIWSARDSIKDAIVLARALRDDVAAVEDKGNVNVK